MPWLERLIIAGFGIRGIASFYYLTYTLNHPAFADLGLALSAERLWAVVEFVVMTSILVHGVAANPVMTLFTHREQNGEESSET